MTKYNKIGKYLFDMWGITFFTYKGKALKKTQNGWEYSE